MASPAARKHVSASASAISPPATYCPTQKAAEFSVTFCAPIGAAATSRHFDSSTAATYAVVSLTLLTGTSCVGVGLLVLGDPFNRSATSWTHAGNSASGVLAFRQA